MIVLVIDLAVEQLDADGDAVLLGGGKDQFLPKRAGGRRSDETDMIAAFQKSGYAHVSNRQELETVRGGKVLGIFSQRDMSFELDRDKLKEPSLAEMTRATIRLLHHKHLWCCRRRSGGHCGRDTQPTMCARCPR